MRKLLPSMALVLCASTFAASNLTSPTDQLSYAIGYKTGQAMKQQSVTINQADFSQGLQAGYTGQQPAVSEENMQTALTNMQQQMAQNMQQKYTQQAQANLEAGQAFLAKNGKEPGVVTLPSGLQYKIVNPGNGDSPTTNDTVTVNYEGKLIDGTVFDSSYKRGQPASFKVGQVIHRDSVIRGGGR